MKFRWKSKVTFDTTTVARAADLPLLEARTVEYASMRARPGKERRPGHALGQQPGRPATRAISRACVHRSAIESAFFELSSPRASRQSADVLWLSRPKEKSLVEARGVETSGSIHLARKQHSLNAMPSTPAKARAHTRDESVPLTTKSVSRTTEARVSTKRRNAAECAPSSKPPASRPTYASRKNAFALAQQRAGQRRQLLELQKIKCLASAPDRVRTPSKRQSKALQSEV